MVQVTITEADALTIWLNAGMMEVGVPVVHMDYWCPHFHHPNIFTSDALPVATITIYPSLEQAPSILGCTPLAWFLYS